MGLLGGNRSPENQQSEGSCPGPQLQGTQRASQLGADRAKSREMCPGPLSWPLGGTVLSFLRGWAAALNSFTQSRLSTQGSAAVSPVCMGAPPLGLQGEPYTGSRAQDSSYCSVFVFCECVLHSLVHSVCHPSNGCGDHPCLYLAVS